MQIKSRVLASKSSFQVNLKCFLNSEKAIFFWSQPGTKNCVVADTPPPPPRGSWDPAWPLPRHTISLSQTCSPAQIRGNDSTLFQVPPTPRQVYASEKREMFSFLTPCPILYCPTISSPARTDVRLRSQGGGDRPAAFQRRSHLRLVREGRPGRRAKSGRL